MDKIDLGFVLNSVNGELTKGSTGYTVNDVSTDSRKAAFGSLFIPLIGENHDAHKFLEQVYENGCRAIIVSDENWNQKMHQYGDMNIIKVENTLTALQDLAKAYLNSLNLKKISVTGSVGKTTTKDLLYSIIKRKYKTQRNIGNLNNDIGVPLTIFTFDSTMEVVIVEMGMGYDGHIDRLAEIVKPEVAIVTTIGSSHIEIHNSREGILKEKLKITKYFNKDNILVINETCDLLNMESIKKFTNGNFTVKTVGNDNSDFIVRNIKDLGTAGIKFNLIYSDDEYEINLPLLGAHNAINAALAIAASLEAGLSINEAVLGLSDLDMTRSRLEIKKTSKYMIIDDTYNASKESMCAALDSLKAIKGKRKIAILGDMYELGDSTMESHVKVGSYASEIGIDLLIAIGDYAVDIAEAARKHGNIGSIYYFKTKEEFYPLIKDLLKEDDIVLVKASRGMGLEQVVKNIENID